MIRLNVFLLIEEDKNRQPLIDAATELVELSLHDEGCIGYDLFSSLTVTNHLMICETWKDRESLKAHMASPHFRRLVPQLESLATMTLEEFTF
ncbi:MAG: antibiotic biosynthesis monooxygenase [Paramuribaculum sp.]|nr:antibiotic biosynthesis monooxygenase [Paramuribaculum sp.]MDE6304576.1 antibiotic biosynthesis monooxygenase [Paramuribaculum sp.]